jgi:aerobic carbon-monoxide dehydrogenase small subunit
MHAKSEARWATVNGCAQPLPLDGRRLVDWLRDDLELFGTKEPCSSGQCGGCSVLLDDEPVLSCCVLAATCAGRAVVTIEGLADDSAAAPLLEAFVRCGATQCGYCTPGMVVVAHALLSGAEGAPAAAQPIDAGRVRAALAGNICRCTGYVQIVEAVIEGARMRGLPTAGSVAPTWSIAGEEVRT